MTSDGMLIRIAHRCCFLLLAVGLASAQAEFSADIVDVQQPGPFQPTLAKIYSSKDRKRIELQTSAREDSIVVVLTSSKNAQQRTELLLGGPGKIFILYPVAKVSTILVPGDKTYMQGIWPRTRLSEMFGFYPLLHPADVENGCEEWMKGAAAEGETCRNIGHEMINGRDAIKYDLSCYGEVCHLWIDSKLHVLVKRETKWTSTELHNIQEASQAENLFEIPAGYTRVEQKGPIRKSTPQ